VTAIDLLIVGAVVGAAWAGVRTGLAVQVGMFVGLVLGLLLGATVAPTVAGWADGRTAKALLALAAVGLGTSVLGTVGEVAGRWAADHLERIRLGRADRALGGVASGVTVLVVVWLLAGSLVRVPNAELGRKVQASTVVRGLDRWLPPAPDVMARLGALLSPTGFPPVFADLEPSPSGPVSGPNPQQLAAAGRVASASTVRVLGDGCGSVEGSGFVAGDDLVVTNAHVVAGASTVAVVDGGGRHRAEVVGFDPDLDVAVLRAGDLRGPALALAATDGRRGTVGAILGYPGNGPLVVGAAAVRDRFVAVGRDIYGDGRVRRVVYELQADVRPGNSGGPFVTPQGEVAGLVFARSVRHGDIGYALAASEVRPALAAAERRSEPVATGGCTGR
jgi:uncharacterized membrane protein required for colicin V production